MKTKTHKQLLKLQAELRAIINDLEPKKSTPVGNVYGPTASVAEPRCVECGGELAESDIEAGEDVCLDCAAALALERDAESAGLDADGIEHEPGTLLATVQVLLDKARDE